MGFPYVGAGGTSGVNVNDVWPASSARLQIMGFRRGSTAIGVDGYTYYLTLATADVPAGTAGYPATGVPANHLYWKREVDLKVASGGPSPQPLAISGTPQSATQNQAYSFTPTTTGGSGTRTYSRSGTLPAGLSFSSTTGAITGTPTVSGTFSGLAITVSDATGSATLSGLSIVVAAAAAARAAAKRIAIIGDSFGQRAQDVTGSPSRAFAGRVYGATSVSGVLAGDLVIDGLTYVLVADQTATQIRDQINNRADATVTAEIAGSSPVNRLVLMSKTRNRNVVITSAPSGTGLTTGTFTPEVTSAVGTDAVVNPVLFQWPYADTGTGGAITSTGVGGVTWSLANAIQAISNGAYVFPFEINRATGGANSGQWNRFVDDIDRLKQAVATFQEDIDAGRKIDGCLINLGTNDTQATFTASASYDNVKSVCDRIAGMGIPIVIYTIAPRGEPAFTAARLGNVNGTDKRPMAREFNARILGTSFNGTSYPGLAAESTLAGKIRVVDITTPLLDPAPAVDFDILPAYAYDGLHLSPLGAFTVAPALLAAFDALLTATVTPPLATNDNTGNILGTKGLMAGTTGTLTRTGNATTNAGFTLSGTAPTGWLVATSSNWPGTDPNNTKGTVTVSKGTADAGEAIVVDAALDGSGRSNSNTYRLELSTDIDMTQFTAGEFMEGLARLKLTGLSGFRSADIQFILTEPDGVVRTLRTHAPPPNGTLRPDWPQTDRTMTLRTQRRRVKSGTYSSAKLLIALNFAGNVAGITMKAELSQVAVRKAPFPT